MERYVFTDVRKKNFSVDVYKRQGTDHTREYVPLIAYSRKMEGGGALENEDTFAVIGASVAVNFGVNMPEGTIGQSILKKLV